MHLPPLRHLAAATLLACATLSAHAQVTTGTMNEPRMFHQATALSDGKVLITGGVRNQNSPLLASTEVYDPATGTFQLLAPMKAGTRDHAAIALKDGRILVAGGMNDVGSPSFAEIFDPATGIWTATGEMNTYFSRAMARLLPDGRVMVADRGESGGHHAEIYDPVKGTFSKSGDMIEQTRGHGMVVLADGRVLKVGGYSNGYSRNAEIWDPATNMWSPAGQMFQGRQDIQPVLLADGKVLVAGGRMMDMLSSTEIYDPATGTFSRAGDMLIPFAPDSGTLLGNGNILFTDPNSRIMLQYQPATGIWNFAGPKRNATRETSVTRLPNGDLLMAGGTADYDATSYAAVFDQACGGEPVRLYNANATAPFDGGIVSFTVNGAPGCRFDVTDLPSWLTPNPGNAMRVGENGSSVSAFTAAANTSGAERNASFYLANEMAMVSQAASANCPSAPYVSPVTTRIGYQGGAGTANVYAPAGCSWNVSSLPSFVTATSATSGKGNGTFTYSVPANTASTSRSSNGLLTALGQSSSFTFTQDGKPLCPSMPRMTYTSLSFPSNGGTIGVTVSAEATCPWSISQLPTWVKLAPGSNGNGTGNGGFSLKADPNGTGAARGDTGMVSGPGYDAAFYLTQEASACATLSASTASISASATGTVGTINITASPSCNWNVSSTASWASVLGTNYGVGNGSFNYSIAANSGASRSATLSLSGINAAFPISVNQAAAPVNSCTTAIASGTPVNGFLKSMGCPAGTRGSSYYTDRYTFTGTGGKVATIAMSSSSFDTYLYLRDQAGNIVKADDDSGGGTNSRISFVLPSSGTYTIEATSYGSNSTGAYSLSFIQ